MMTEKEKTDVFYNDIGKCKPGAGANRTNACLIRVIVSELV